MQMLRENQELENELMRVREGNQRAAEILAGPLPPPLPQQRESPPRGPGEEGPPLAVATAGREHPPADPHQPPPEPHPEPPKRPRLDDD